MSVKRAAPTSSAPPAKKRREATKPSSSKSKSASAPAKKRHQQAPSKTQARRKPVTASANDENDNGASSDEDDAGDDNDEFPLVDLGDDLEGEESNEMDVDQENAPPKDPNAARESHKVQKEQLRARQASKPHATALADAKRHWSLARQKTLSRAEREKHVAQLLDAVQGKVQDLVFKHDASRVVQTIVKCGGQKERMQVALELKGRYRDLAQNKYAKFLVTKLLKYCPTLRSQILAEFHTHVLRLLLHREASPILADAYELYASAADRDRLLVDLFGKEVVLFADEKTATGDSDKEDSKTSKARGLKAVLENADPERRKRILTALKDNLINIFNNPDKGAVGHAIVHRALWEYLQELNADAILGGTEAAQAEADRKRSEVFESCQELVAEMVHTKEGSRAVREFLACGTAKDRKQIIKVLKPHIERMCKDDEAQLVLFTALDVVDDTKLIAKSIISEILPHFSKFAFDSHKHGRRALLYLLVPRSPRHFTPAFNATLAETDAARKRTSKKDPEVREREIRVAATEGAGRSGLLAAVESEERMDEMCRDPGASLLLGEILLYSEGDRQAAIKTLTTLLSRPYPTPTPSNGQLMHLIDVPHAARLIKTLVQGGHYSRSSSAVTPAPAWPVRDFVRALVRSVERDDVRRIAAGGGAFLVAELVKRVVDDADAEGEDGLGEERQILKGWFDDATVEGIKQKKPKGFDVLAEELKRL